MANLMPEKRTIFILPILVHFHAVADIRHRTAHIPHFGGASRALYRRSRSIQASRQRPYAERSTHVSLHWAPAMVCGSKCGTSCAHAANKQVTSASMPSRFMGIPPISTTVMTWGYSPSGRGSHRCRASPPHLLRVRAPRPLAGLPQGGRRRIGWILGLFPLKELCNGQNPYTGEALIRERRQHIKPCGNRFPEHGLDRCPQGSLSHQCLQQRLGLLQVGRVKALGEPAIDRPQEVTGLIPLALLLPQPCQARGRAQLPGHGLLMASDGQSLLEAGFGLGGSRDGVAQEEGALEPIRLREQIAQIGRAHV